MLRFNLLLKDAGIDPKDVYLVRHQDTRNSKQSAYNLYKSALRQFEIYQSLQRKDCFGDRPLIASFIAAPLGRTLFIGLYRNRGLDAFPETLHECPLSGIPVGPEAFVYYRLEPDSRLEEFNEKLSIDWGAGYRAWIQTADAKVSGDKPIVEIVRSVQEEAFPGFRKFSCDIAEISFIWPSWQEHLRTNKGIYLLTCKDTGKQYVGKADGNDGFLGRFLCYATTGHGGNEGMKKHTTSGYLVTILEAVATPVQGDLDDLQSVWKDKLGTRIWGLNEN